MVAFAMVDSPYLRVANIVFGDVGWDSGLPAPARSRLKIVVNFNDDQRDVIRRFDTLLKPI
jgi:hypothetical protein